jgi:phosphoglycerate-specific signal transduction histidine kinase
MVTLNKRKNSTRTSKARAQESQRKKLALMGEITKGIINELYSPIDATNRFINLALQSIGENPQGRQFLLESKEGIRKTSLILKKLNNYARKVEEEIRNLPDEDK